jgi:uncharacterized circularly permuted ATP-grasp superfamily protein/uncharacterized alpha-E superfamily protein
MPRELLAHYRLAPGRYDEAFESEERPREHWRAAFERLAAARPDTIAQGQQAVQRELRESGVTHNAYAQGERGHRPWELDLLPLILPEPEWREIEAAVAQRAELFNRVLLDLYGAQELVRDGLLPAALVYGNPGFLRPLAGVRVPADVMLHTYAADLARAPDGRWWVVGDRTQVPWGAGYALENRVVLSRVIAEPFRELRARRLAAFFAEMRDGLAHWPTADPGAPLTVLLTPGYRSETYFEQSYLARYLGFPLVEGGDLTVRDGKVWLKTLAGLQRVTTIVRRLEDDYCDPLELRSDSALGVPGLIGAVRTGSVYLANALGSGAVESPALLGFLPRICERLMGTGLRMPSVATWWCGEPAALEEALSRLDRLVVRGAHPHARTGPEFVDELAADARGELVHRLRARPGQYVAQELIRVSQAPVIDPHHPRQLAPRAIGLRVFACATPRGYAVMPGGLAHAALGPDSRALSAQRGGTSKDTWVLSSGPVGSFSLLRREVRAQDLVRTGANLSSRVTENLFWLGRLAERCDNDARLLRAALSRLLDLTATERGPDGIAMIDLLRRAEIFAGAPPESDAALLAGLRAAIEDEERPGLAAALRQLLFVSAQLRERLSTDNWRTLNGAALRLERLRRRELPAADLLAELDHAITSFMTLSGYALDGMTRDAGWWFLSLGRRIERLQFMSHALQAALAGAADMELDWLLEVGDSGITYRSRYMARPQWLPVLDLLARDPSNPRSIAFQLKGLEDFLRRILEAYGDFGAERFADLAAELAGMDADRELQHGSAPLAALLGQSHARASRLSEQVELRFFSHAGAVSRQTFAV